MADITVFEKVAQEVADTLIAASDELAEIFRGNPSLLQAEERKRFNRMTEADIELMRQEKGDAWVEEWVAKMIKGQRR